MNKKKHIDALTLHYIYIYIYIYIYTIDMRLVNATSVPHIFGYGKQLARYNSYI